MKATYRFVQHLKGISAFAVVGFDVSTSSEDSVSWHPRLHQFENIYSKEVKEGIQAALDHHTRNEGAALAFQVIEFQTLLVDTKPDAVRCASAAAAWMALGHSEKEVHFHCGDEWEAVISAPT